MLPRCLFAFCVVSALCAAAPLTFSTTVRPLLARHCIGCHNEKLRTGGLALDHYRNAGSTHLDREVWEKVLKRIRGGEMPPPGNRKPDPAQARAMARWIEGRLAWFDRTLPPDPGRVTAHRLNRAEYNNTVRDLLGVDLRPADDFPIDDSGYGFDNIGDVLSLSPVLMEKYLGAAEKVARAAIVVPVTLKPTLERYQADTVALTSPGAIEARHVFAADAEYELRAGVVDRRPEGSPASRVALFVDDRQVKLADLPSGPGRPRILNARLPVQAGSHPIRVAFLDDQSRPYDPNPPGAVRNVFVDFLEVRGPFDAQQASLPESHRRIFRCGHASGAHQPECARTILSDLSRRAWRRPVTSEEVGKLSAFVSLAERENEPFERGIQLGLQAILVSPHFLFRIERDRRPADPLAVHLVGEFELASRISYFLWSSMPDEELFRAAEKRTLRKPGVLALQLRRMLKDPRAEAFTENFAGQWLQLRNLDSVSPDPARFPAFTNELREDMRRETRLFFEAVMREDRSILDFIDGRFTFLNQRLARHYGITGIEGDPFRRVALAGNQRSGVLTQASVLTISSYPTRTSPVLRGLWVLENFLAAPPPPPPPDVPQLDEKQVGLTGTLRRQLEQHRTNPSCAVCHTRMDSIGFGLENYDAIGAWRTHDGKFPVDAAGGLPGGTSFRTPRQLKGILLAEKDEFARCLTEKMLTYAIGRGLERYDKPAVRRIVRRLALNNYRFSSLILEIVTSMPFQKRRGDPARLPEKKS